MRRAKLGRYNSAAIFAEFNPKISRNFPKDFRVYQRFLLARSLLFPFIVTTP
jgi:hypothetical protein